MTLLKPMTAAAAAAAGAAAGELGPRRPRHATQLRSRGGPRGGPLALTGAGAGEGEGELGKGGRAAPWAERTLRRRGAVVGAVVATLAGCAFPRGGAWGEAAARAEGGEAAAGEVDEEEEAAAREWYDRNGASFVLPSLSPGEYARVIRGVGPRAFEGYEDQIRDAAANPVRYNACAEAVLVGDLDAVLQSVFYLPFALAGGGHARAHARALVAQAAADDVEAAREPLVRGLREAARSVDGPTAAEQQRLLDLAADLREACLRVAAAAE